MHCCAAPGKEVLGAGTDMRSRDRHELRITITIIIS